MATVRAWLLYMTVDQHELKSIKADWERTFDKLPTDGTASVKNPKDALQWRTLSRYYDRHTSTSGAPPPQFVPCRSHPFRVLTGGIGRSFADYSAPAGRLPSDSAVSSALENPPVNPLTGLGRTAADVARDTNQYHTYVRNQTAEISGLAPVFQADYLILTPPGPHSPAHLLAKAVRGMGTPPPGV